MHSSTAFTSHSNEPVLAPQHISKPRAWRQLTLMHMRHCQVHLANRLCVSWLRQWVDKAVMHIRQTFNMEVRISNWGHKKKKHECKQPQVVPEIYFHLAKGHPTRAAEHMKVRNKGSVRDGALLFLFFHTLSAKSVVMLDRIHLSLSYVSGTSLAQFVAAMPIWRTTEQHLFVAQFGATEAALTSIFRSLDDW